jgi:hypothetical protein
LQGSVRCSLRTLRSVLRSDSAQTVELALRRVELILQLHLTLDELADLAVDLARLLDHQLAQQTLAQLTDRDDGTGALATLVRGDLVRSVSVLVAHECHSTFVRVRCQARGKPVWMDCG